MATLNLGRIKPVFKGAWNSGAFVIDDIVTHGNETFICIQAGTNKATTDAAYWTKLAAKGSDGTDLTSTLATQGQIVYRDGSGLAALNAGTAGQVLQTGGSGANPSWATQAGGRTLQMKALHFDDAINYGSATWGNHSHPLGDGTIQMTPKATGNLIEVRFDFHCCGGSTWQSAQYRALVSTDSGSNWSYVTSGNSDGGAIGAHDIYNESKTVSSTTYFGFWHITANTNLHQFKIQGFGRTGGGGDHINQNGEAGGQERSRVVMKEIDMTGSDFTSGAL
tara:strand:- start:6048 stop:6884 length:837 start_codon:yes stop_codon:yes gene_type:complete